MSASQLSTSQKRLNPFKTALNSRLFKIMMLGTLSMAGILLKGPAQAADRVIIKLGPFQQAIEVEDIENYAQTGKVSSSLKPFAHLLTPDVQRVLSDHLELNPEQVDQLIDETLNSPTADKTIQAIKLALPGVSIDYLQTALMLAARQANGLSVSNVLHAYPEESITIDASALMDALSKLNLPYLGTKAIDTYLEEQMTVENGTLRSPLDPSVAGSDRVQQERFTLRDTQRNRVVEVELYWSDQTQRDQPLVVISHGLGTSRQYLGYLAQHLASHGFSVAALEHPGSNINWQIGVPLPLEPKQLISGTEFINLPADISFVLDELAQLNQKAGPLQGKLNTEKVSVIGHSLGGYTALAVAGAELQLDELRDFCQNLPPVGYAAGDWLQCSATQLIGNHKQLRDERVVQAVALNPVVGHLFGTTGLSKVATPTLILASTEDPLTPALTHQLQPFVQLPNPKYLLTAFGGTHLSIAPAPPATRSVSNTAVAERQGPETDSLRQLLKGVTLAFVKQQTPDADQYVSFLTPAYAQSLSTTTLPLRLSTELPENVSRWLQVKSPQ
jgi:predicted dienelactone hydrolase